MKKLIFILSTVVVLIATSCNQNSPAPASSSSTSPTPTPTSNFTSADSAISGNWILDAVESYTMPANTLILSTPHNDPANCHLNLMLVTASPNNYKQLVFGLTCSPSSSVWRLVAGDLELGGGIFNIVSQTPTNLVLKLNGSGGTMYGKYLLHK